MGAWLRRGRGGAGASTFAALRIRNFRLFFAGQLVSSIGNWLTGVAQTLFVLNLTNPGVALVVLAGARFGPAPLLGSPPSFPHFLPYLCLADGQRARTVLGFTPRLSIKRTILDFLGVAPEDGATDIARASV